MVRATGTTTSTMKGTTASIATGVASGAITGHGREDHPVDRAAARPAGRLDTVDVRLVAALALDARMSYQALADEVGLSRTAVRARTRHLLTSGAVHLLAIPHPAVADLAVDAWLLVNAADAGAAAAALADHPSVYAVQAVAGRWTVTARIRARDDHALAADLDHIRALEPVQGVQVVRVLSGVLDPFTPTDLTLEPAPAIDGLDWVLMELLQADPRAPFSELAHRIALSQAATRARVVGMLGAGVLRTLAIPDPARIGLPAQAGFVIEAGHTAAAVAGRLAQIPGVRSVVTGWGAADVVGQVHAPGTAALAAVLDAVRTAEGVAAMSSWSVLDQVLAEGPLRIADLRAQAGAGAPAERAVAS